MKSLIATAFISLISVLIPQSHSQAIPIEQFSGRQILPTESAAPPTPTDTAATVVESPDPSLTAESSTAEPEAIARSEYPLEVVEPNGVQDPRHLPKDPCPACGMG